VSRGMGPMGTTTCSCNRHNKAHLAPPPLKLPGQDLLLQVIDYCCKVMGLLPELMHTNGCRGKFDIANPKLSTTMSGVSSPSCYALARGPFAGLAKGSPMGCCCPYPASTTRMRDLFEFSCWQMAALTTRISAAVSSEMPGSRVRDILPQDLSCCQVSGHPGATTKDVLLQA
jgi:hypothetical protein